MQTFNFPKQMHLLTAFQFQAVFDQNNLRVSSREILILAKPNDLDHPRMGLVVAKKNLRLAVTRNRFKRSARETFRLQQHSLPAVDIIILARKGAGEIDQSRLVQMFDDLWCQLIKRHKKLSS